MTFLLSLERLLDVNCKVPNTRTMPFYINSEWRKQLTVLPQKRLTLSALELWVKRLRNRFLTFSYFEFRQIDWQNARF